MDRSRSSRSAGKVVSRSKSGQVRKSGRKSDISVASMKKRGRPRKGESPEGSKSIPEPMVKKTYMKQVKSFVSLKPLPDNRKAATLSKKAAAAAETAKITSDGRRYWTQEEDDVIRQYLPLYGRKWQRIANHLPSRTGRQVRERVMESLTFVALLKVLDQNGPLMVEEGAELKATHDWTENLDLGDVQLEPWNEAEDEIVRNCIEKEGLAGNWSEISNRLSDRNRTTVRMRAATLYRDVEGGWQQYVTAPPKNKKKESPMAAPLITVKDDDASSKASRQSKALKKSGSRTSKSESTRSLGGPASSGKLAAHGRSAS